MDLVEEGYDGSRAVLHGTFDVQGGSGVLYVYDENSRENG